MVAGRPIRIVVASLAIIGAAVLTLIGFVKPAIESVYGCDDCTLGTPPIILIGIPLAYVILAVGLLVRPAALARPMAISCVVAAIALIGPVAQMPDPTLAAVVLCLVGGAMFILGTPLGDRASRWALPAWIVSLGVAILLWVLDSWGSNYMLTEPVGDQPAFLVVAIVLFGAGLISIGLGIVETSDAAAEVR